MNIYDFEEMLYVDISPSLLKNDIYKLNKKKSNNFFRKLVSKLRDNNFTLNVNLWTSHTRENVEVFVRVEI